VVVICAISLPAVVITYMLGEQREFPTYSSAHASFAAFMVQIGATMTVAFVVWRGARASVRRSAEQRRLTRRRAAP